MRRSALLAIVATAATLPAFEARAQVYVRRNAHGVMEATNVPASPDYRLIYPGKGTLIHSTSFRRSSYRGEYDAHIIDAARTYGVSPDLVKAVIRVESEFDRYARSSKGAQGLMQLMPFTAQRFGVADAFDPRQNVFGGTQYLRLLLDLFGGDLTKALAAYNAGEGAVLRYKGVPPFKETQAYVVKVRAALDGDPGPLPMVASAPPSLVLTPISVRANDAANPRGKAKEYYRWRDAAGVLHVATTPPSTPGTPFTVIRAED